MCPAGKDWILFRTTAAQQQVSTYRAGLGALSKMTGKRKGEREDMQ
jgi:hypothetical protein